MNPERLLKHFDLLAEAPDAIPRLRRFILDLAVRGKLVEQDPDDESALELLSRLAIQKARQVEAGEIRKPRELSNNQEIGKLFDIPASWCWCRLDAVGAVIGGGTPSAADPENFAEPTKGIPWLTPADFGRHTERYIARGSRDLSEKGLKSSSATLLPKGTVLFTNRAPIGYVAIAKNPIATNQGFKSIVPYVLDCSRFVALAMKAFAPMIDANAPGTTFKEVSGKIVAAIPFPLPPLAEQHRIATRVDELMALCDRLEAAQAEREQRRDRLVTASLSQLQNQEGLTQRRQARKDDSFASLAPLREPVFIRDIPRLTTHPAHIKALRQTILSLAVRGCLVPQCPSDEPASELLTRITATKEPSRRPAVTIDTNNAPFSLPLSWEWASLDQLIVSGPQNGISPKPTLRTDAPRAITLTATTSGVFNPAHFKHVEINVKNESNYWLQEGDLLFQRGNTREYVGIAAVYEGPPDAFLFPDLIMRVRVSKAASLRFIHLAAISPPARKFLSENASGAQKTMPKINQKTLASLPIPLPPLAEQNRIVAKVDELLAVCDQLETQLTATQADSRRLLEAVLRDALAPAMGKVA